MSSEEFTIIIPMRFHIRLPAGKEARDELVSAIHDLPGGALWSTSGVHHECLGATKKTIRAAISHRKAR